MFTKLTVLCLILFALFLVEVQPEILLSDQDHDDLSISFPNGEEVETLTYRQLVAANNMKVIKDHNSKSDKTSTLYPYKMFLSLTLEEVGQKYLIQNPAFVIEGVMYPSKVQVKNLKLEDSKVGAFGPGKNWINQTGPVLNQGNCGSCYAFAAIQSMRFAFKLKGINVELSAQQIVDCTFGFGNLGCLGGWAHYAFNYAMVNSMYNSGVYPYSAATFYNSQNQQCRSVASQPTYKLTNWYWSMYSCGNLAIMINTRVPTVAITAKNSWFLYYQSGIITYCGNSYTIDHAVAVVGYTNEYWIIKNSWGTAWGEAGYARISNTINYGNLCQICYVATYADV